MFGPRTWRTTRTDCSYCYTSTAAAGRRSPIAPTATHLLPQRDDDDRLLLLLQICCRGGQGTCSHSLDSSSLWLHEENPGSLRRSSEDDDNDCGDGDYDGDEGPRSMVIMMMVMMHSPRPMVIMLVMVVLIMMKVYGDHAGDGGFDDGQDKG